MQSLNKSSGIPLRYKNTKNTIEHLQLIKNAINTTHKSTMKLKPKEGDKNKTFLNTVMQHAAVTRTELNKEDKNKELTPKIVSILGDIDKKQLEEQAYYAKKYEPGQITQRHLMYADLYLLENYREKFIEKHNLDKRGLTPEEMDNLLSKYKFKATSEKLQTMTNIAKRAQENINQNSTKMINYLDNKINKLKLKSSNQPTIDPNNKLAAYFQTRHIQQVNNRSSTV